MWNVGGAFDTTTMGGGFLPRHALFAVGTGKEAANSRLRKCPVADEVFHNEPAADFSQAANRQSMTVALTKVRASLKETYPLFINGRDVPERPTATSINPARPSEVVGHVCQATAADLDAAVAATQDAFSTWRETRPGSRAAYLLRAASALRKRIWEASAMLVLEVGKPWDQASHDVAEAIDFLE